MDIILAQMWLQVWYCCFWQPFSSTIDTVTSRALMKVESDHWCKNRWDKSKEQLLVDIQRERYMNESNTHQKERDLEAL